MRQINLIGFSTVGKTFLANSLVSYFNNYKLFDTDKEIAKPEYKSISEIYYGFEDVNDAHLEIRNRETRIIQNLISNDDNLIVASGPSIPLNQTFSTYISSRKPFVILLEKSAEDIYDSFVQRRTKLKVQDYNPRFGIWDVNVIVDSSLNEFSKEEAIEKINSLLKERDIFYKQYANLKLFITHENKTEMITKLREEIAKVCT